MSDRIVKNLEKKGIKLPISQKSIGLYNPYIFEERGLHSRPTIDCHSLPLNASVEIDAMFEIL